MMRAVTSATPPGPNGSTIRTGFSGHFASAAPGASDKVSVAAIIASARFGPAKTVVLTVESSLGRSRAALMKVCIVRRGGGCQPPCAGSSVVVEPRGIGDQDALERRRVAELRQEIDELAFIRLVRRVRMREVGAPHGAVRQ